MRGYSPFLALGAAFLAISAIHVTYMAADVVPSRAIIGLTDMALAFAFTAWVRHDAERRGRVPCFDFAFLVGVFLPIALPWYVFWSRGWRGFLTLAALGGLLLLTLFSPGIAWLVIHGGGLR